MDLNREAPSAKKTVRPVVVSRWASPLVFLLGLGFIFASLGQMGALINYYRWSSFFPGHPGSLIQLLYWILWGTSLVGVVVGVGLWSHKDFFRKASIFLVCVSLAGAYGKHPHEGFVLRMRLMSEQMAAQGSPFSSDSILQFVQAWNISWLTESSLAWGCVALIMILEILFALAIVFFLTRPSVKALFR